MIRISKHVAKLFLNGKLEGFTALQMAYLVKLYECKFKNYTETDINNELQQYHPNKRVWAPVAMTLSNRVFIERGGIVYDIHDLFKEKFKLSKEQGSIIHTKETIELFNNKYNIINIFKFKKIFDIIVNNDTYSEDHYKEMIDIMEKYNKILFNIDNTLNFYRVKKSNIDELIEGLRKHTWHRVLS